MLIGVFLWTMGKVGVFSHGVQRVDDLPKADNCEILYRLVTAPWNNAKPQKLRVTKMLTLSIREAPGTCIRLPIKLQEDRTLCEDCLGSMVSKNIPSQRLLDKSMGS